MIDSIAFQTDMLALNAAVEAAREVNDVVAGIAVASQAQSAGIEQVGQAMAQMETDHAAEPGAGGTGHRGFACAGTAGGTLAAAVAVFRLQARTEAPQQRPAAAALDLAIGAWPGITWSHGGVVHGRLRSRGAQDCRRCGNDSWRLNAPST